jgi:hypothetical protein
LKEIQIKLDQGKQIDRAKVGKKMGEKVGEKVGEKLSTQAYP